MSGAVLRLLAVDFGEARIGLAGTDALGLMAHPVETVPSQPRKTALERIAEVARQRQAQRIVMGLPIRADGTEGPAAEKVRKFAAMLRPLLPPDCEIVWQDEDGSTIQAHAMLRAAGKKTHNHRPVIDQAAAVAILEEYLRAMHPGSIFADEGD